MALERSIANLKEAVKVQEGVFTTKSTRAQDATKLKKEVDEISHEFALVKKADGVPKGHSSGGDGMEGAKKTKPSPEEQKLAQQQAVLEKKAAALVAQAEAERGKVPLELKQAQDESAASAKLLNRAMAGQAKYQRLAEAEDRAQAAKRQAEEKATLTKASAAMAAREEALRKAEQEKAKNAAAANAKEAPVAQPEHTEMASGGEDPDLAADAVVSEEDGEELTGAYTKWLADGGGGGVGAAESVTVFCSGRGKGERHECAATLRSKFLAASRPQLRAAGDGGTRGMVEAEARKHSSRGKTVCDPASPAYMRCLGVRATGATLSPSVAAARRLTIQEAQRMVAEGIAKLIAKKRAAAHKRLGIVNMRWASHDAAVERPIKTVQKPVKTVAAVGRPRGGVARALVWRKGLAPLDKMSGAARVVGSGGRSAGAQARGRHAAVVAAEGKERSLPGVNVNGFELG